MNIDRNEFWNNKVSWKENGDTVLDGRCVRIKGAHYLVAPENERGMRGFGGAIFKIRWTSGPFEGEEVVTTNLWHQGTIPSDYAERLSDNAEWVKGEPIGGSYAFLTQRV